MMDGLIDLVSSPTFLKWLLGMISTGLTGLAGFIMKKIFSTVKGKIKQFEDGLTEISKKVDLAVNNHLHTIQDNTTKTNEILLEMSKSQADLVGYLRAKAEDGKL
jgi:hypothetical protein